MATFATIMISRDHGATWTVGKPAYSGGNECQAAQLGDGSIMLNMRNDHERFRAVFVTKDLGQTWQPHATNRNTLIEPNCNGSLLRVDYEAGGRQETRAAVRQSAHAARRGRTTRSRSASTTAAPGRSRITCCSTKAAGAGYPSLTRVDDAHVGIVYEGSQSHLVFGKGSRWRNYSTSDAEDWTHSLKTVDCRQHHQHTHDPTGHFETRGRHVVFALRTRCIVVIANTGSS